eukprot:TRINITY_DN2239_c0_g1_i3.p1 TRINITY_DN2239_c0_g1~~TRINITY_DN2239_c0_g1_i3.p1  ORF type:complete len:255 (+),score=53.69 TRINITY_DN2239_c0_g1_i3:1-765(+)
MQGETEEVTGENVYRDVHDMMPADIQLSPHTSTVLQMIPNGAGFIPDISQLSPEQLQGATPEQMYNQMLPYLISPTLMKTASPNPYQFQGMYPGFPAFQGYASIPAAQYQNAYVRAPVYYTQGQYIPGMESQAIPPEEEERPGKKRKGGPSKSATSAASSSPDGQKGKSNQRHNDSERRRRNKISCLMEELRGLVPNCKNSKSSILEATTTYVEELKTQTTKLQLQNEALENENAALEQELKELTHNKDFSHFS